MKVLRVVLDGEEKPTYTITKAFEKAFDYVETVWWYEWYNNRNELNRGLKHKLETENFDVVFMQLQEANVVYPETFENIYEKTLIFNWSGDVRPHVDYFTSIGKYCVTLFSNDTDTHKMRALGFRSDYLQTGYDHKWYYNTNSHRLNKIAFIGKNYDHSAYSNESLIAINIAHINCNKYYSDRKLRAMACGSLVLSQTYENADHEFKSKMHYDNWDDIGQLIDKCHYYIENRDLALKIGKNASEFVLEKCTWDYRMEEFKNLIIKYKY